MVRSKSRQVVSLLAMTALGAVPDVVVGAFVAPSVIFIGSKTSVDRIVATAASKKDDGWSNDDSSSSDNKKPIRFDDMINLNGRDGSSSSSAPQFAQGDALQRLRNDLQSFRENLKWAKAVEDRVRVHSLRRKIEELENRDAEITYNKSRLLMAEAQAASHTELKPDARDQLIRHWSEQARLARECLPRFQMEGLWVGNYGGGPELVNITYAGDTLVATKVTSDENVPRGEVSFTANLSPPPLNGSDAEGISDYASPSSTPSSSAEEEHTVLQSKYGESIFPGQGQLAMKNFQDNKFISGVFVVYDSHRFSFSWVPTKHHVFFVRPSPHETLRLLRDVISNEDEVDNMRDHLSRCFDMDMTTSIACQHIKRRSMEGGGVPEDPFRRIRRQSDLELLRNSFDVDSKRRGGIFQFWRASKWKKYIDRVLGNDGGMNTMQ